ncbi:MAG: hypothetical protein A2W01_02830 [Candidatus Solincola sediminis]|uniref:VWFA domain-containing protein n=1 Tax=Candidatus Solincola sediminis TaxID=1797199 RepID=A0A1F2WT91_9ACTN|nr:MAG: hypothetical protein A2W01_02830 [Candidatus Solincola sediminis]OFW60089.1 MAG: hypothetical protein A2Y75_02040 [Candidatus Solincola sediminis]
MTSPLNLAIYKNYYDNAARESAVTFEEAKDCFPLFAKGLSEKYLHAKTLEEAPDYLANVFRPFPFSNGREIYLPAIFDVFESRDDNWRAYRVYTAVQAGQWEAGSFDRPARALIDRDEPLAWIASFLGTFAIPVLATDIFITLENIRISTQMARRFAGFASDLAYFLQRLGSPVEPFNHRLILWNLFFAAMGFSFAVPAGILEHAVSLKREGAGLKESLQATGAIYDKLEPGCKSRFSPFMPADMREVGGFPRDIMRLAGSDKVNQRQYFEDSLADLDFYSYPVAAGSGEFVTKKILGDRLNGNVEPKRQAEATITGSGGCVDATLFSYPEWDYLAQGYRKGWVTVLEYSPQRSDPEKAGNLLREWDDLVREVIRQFRMLRFQERAWRKRLEWGEEIDIDQAVASDVERRGGLPGSDKVYMERRRVSRNVSALFLLDLSASTSSAIDEGAHRGESVLEVLLAGTAIMARALGQLGDRYGIYGFSGYGRNGVELLRLKSLNENLSNDVWGRISGLDPMRSTRMGAAIRHAHHLLGRETAPLKIMIILSDGYPQDFDYGEDRADREYGLHDTAKALREVEADCIVPFCLTVDAAGNDYLRRMCPPHGYMVLKSVEDLPAQLPKVYIRLREL